MDVATSLGLESGAWDGVLAALLVNLDAGLSVKQAASGCYVHASARLASLLGRSPDDLVGLTDVDLFGIDAAVLLREADATVLMMGLPQGSEHRLSLNAAQPRRDFKVVCVPLPSAGSAVPEYLAHIWVDMTESLRRAGWQAWVSGSKAGFVADFLVDSAILPSPYASSFGGFVELPTVFWYAAGGCVSSAIQTWDERRKQDLPKDDVPEDMSATSLVGGGLIAGASLAALGLGSYGLLQTVL